MKKNTRRIAIPNGDRERAKIGEMPLAYLIPWLLFASVSQAMTVSSLDVSGELSKAALVVEIRVLSVRTHEHPVFYTSWEADATIQAIQSHTGLESPPKIGEQITLIGPGGERNGIGVTLSGLARPYVGREYLAYLRKSKANQFEVVGFEFGLVPTGAKRVFTRNRTDGSDGTGSGPFLFWADNYFPIPYYVSSPTFAGLPSFVSEIDRSYQTWREVDETIVDFLGMGCTSSDRNENDGINNIIYVSEGWQFNPVVIAITRNFYVAGTSQNAGLILDSDILLNAVNHGFTTSNEFGKHDIRNILTHEIGHVLGLGHETDPTDSEAVMFAEASPNETKKRTLKQNDLLGIRDAYLGSKEKVGNQFFSCNVSEGPVGCAAVHAGTCGGVRLWGWWLPSLILMMAFLAARVWMLRGVTLKTRGRGQLPPTDSMFY